MRGGALSGGEQQMLAIGRALMANPDLILMDEPSEGLSPMLVQHVGADHARRCASTGTRSCSWSRTSPLALSVADYVYVVSAGRFVFEGTPGQLDLAKDILDQHLGVGGESG